MTDRPKELKRLEQQVRPAPHSLTLATGEYWYWSFG